VDALLNIVLLFTFASDATGALQILIFSNLGYVLCHVFAMSGFLLLRKDRPNWPRPLRIHNFWVIVAWVLLVFDTVLLIVGAWYAGLAYGTTGHKTLWIGLLVLGISLVLYVYRVVVQDKEPLRLRLPAAATPEEERLLEPDHPPTV
jgi:amino acid transporter